MDSERSNGAGGGGGDHEVEDEFACAEVLRRSLTSLHSTVERIFRVTFGIGVDGNNGQMWLKLRGPRTSVKAAKVRHFSLLVKLFTGAMTGKGVHDKVLGLFLFLTLYRSNAG